MRTFSPFCDSICDSRINWHSLITIVQDMSLDIDVLLSLWTMCTLCACIRANMCVCVCVCVFNATLYACRTCCTWSLNHTRLHPHEVEALILSAPADRTESQPLTIEVSHTTAEWADTMNAQLQSLGTYPYVTVVSKTT